MERTKTRAAYNGAGHDKRPKRSHRVGFDGLKHSHVVLRILRLDCIGPEIGDARLLGIDAFMLDLLGMSRF